MQVRNYSSGMYVRLGFSLMLEVDADILLVDEVLAVGDAAFQAKCAQSLEEMLFDYTIDSFKARALNLHSSLLELAFVVGWAWPGKPIRKSRKIMPPRFVM